MISDNKKILMVEDEIQITKFVKKGLEMENYEVMLAHDGRAGLAEAETNGYDLIILDLMLPGINGIEIAKSLRQKKIDTPIIMLTALDSIDDKARGLKAGADDYLVKPFAFGELTARIGALIKSRSGKNPVPAEEIDNSENKKNNARHADSASEQEPEGEMAKLNEINKKILDNAPISVITINKDGYITSANRYFKNFSKTKDFRNHNIFTSEFFIRENLVSDYKKLLADGTPIRRENCYEKNSKGEDKYLKIIAVPLRDKDGKIEGALSMAVDNTEVALFKNKLEELNKSLEMRVRQRTAELDIANKELARLLELKATFMSDASHEMRTSLAIIQGNIELMARGLVAPEDSRDTYSQVFEEVSRMTSMLSDLTMLASSDTSIQKFNFKKIELNSLISSVARSLKVVADEKKIKIEHENNKEKIEIMADASKLERLLMNLISNAVRYNKQNGFINILAKTAGKEVFLRVEDGGIGIPKDNLPNIFERFYRVDKARSRNEGGSGLGLAICKWVAEAHGGSIEVKSKVGKGTIFTVRLPVDYKGNQQKLNLGAV